MRELANPNTTDKPVEITRAEVSRVAKTGCNICHGNGCVAYAAKSERGQLQALPKWSLCKCTVKLFRRADVLEIDGKIHWLPGYADVVVPATPPPAPPPRPALAGKGEESCGFRWRSEQTGELRTCVLAPHKTKFDHRDASGACVKHPATVRAVGRAAFASRWACSTACGAGSDAEECPESCWMCGAAMQERAATTTDAAPGAAGA